MTVKLYLSLLIDQTFIILKSVWGYVYKFMEAEKWIDNTIFLSVIITLNILNP